MSKRPNIVFFLVDQWRRDALGAYGNPNIHTPNVDRIARRGVRFNQCIAPGSVCMPIRASIITGRYPSCHGVRGNGIPLRETEVTFTEELQRNGYHTAVIGKLHLVPKAIRRAYLPHPSYGFDTMRLAEGELKPLNDLSHLQTDNIVNTCPDDYSNWLQKEAPDVFRKLSLEPYDYRPDESLCPEEFHQATWVANNAIDFLDEHHDDGNPFYLNVSFFDPHPKFNPPKEFLDMYDWHDMPDPVAPSENAHHLTYPDTKRLVNLLEQQGMVGDELKKLRAAYYGLVSFVDKQIGRVLNRMERLGMLDNTVIVFCSDHGEMLGDHSLIEKGPFHYDQAIRTPLIVSWPEKLPTGTVTDELVQHIDIAPTILECAKVPFPAGVQGKSLLPLMSRKPGSSGYECTLTEDFGFLAVWINVKLLTLRTARYRFTHHLGYPGELYDLQEDPYEQRNLYGEPQYSRVLSELQTTLLDKRLLTSDPLPEFSTMY